MRNGARQLQAKGLFSSAKVVRGPDWKWKDQDGGEGKEGVIKRMEGYSGIPRSAVIVSWNCTTKKGSYRLGYQGKVSHYPIIPRIHSLSLMTVSLMTSFYLSLSVCLSI